MRPWNYTLWMNFVINEDSYSFIEIILKWLHRARCSASSLEPIAGLRNVLWVKVTTTTRTDAARRKINVPRTIIAILRWRLACSVSSTSSTTFWVSFVSIFKGRTESFLRAVLALRDFVLLFVLPLLPFPEQFLIFNHLYLHFLIFMIGLPSLFFINYFL